VDTVASHAGNRCEYCQLPAIGEQKSKAKGWKDMDCGEPNTLSRSNLWVEVFEPYASILCGKPHEAQRWLFELIKSNVTGH